MIAMSSADLRFIFTRLGDAELEAGSRLDDGAGGQRRGVQEDLLAVIGADEAEALLLVVELDLAGWHGNLTSHGGSDDRPQLSLIS
jgi:hypothetical protein